MACMYCHRDIGHHSMCPLFEKSKPVHYCSICGNGIYNGEEYLVNDLNDYRHYDCFYDNRNLLKWLGYEVKIMEDNYD